MVPNTWDSGVHPSTLVAKFSSATIAGHVVAPGRSLDVDTTQWTLLTVGSAPGSGLCPLLEGLVTFLELPASNQRVPWSMAVKAPLKLTLAASYIDILCPVASESSRDFALCQKTTIGTSLARTVFIFFLPQLVKPFFSSTGDVDDDFLSSYNSILALGIWAQNVHLPFVLDTCPYDFLDAGSADHL